ncbi:HAMP domain-containing histidine kinase [Paenibacillus sp. alder61]|uniref:sensor histidine kinase n=1 Tax=Paenibacillus sp. alder61 TaxID=2862948 RepID=UPI001CD72DF1|nr:HAMP domain-containing sensor histidine kinase [Paenibacillus sp. alder61]MCA1291507.1 HAMP domain-containing histidine kinase [Paenibacillus sp. alder61]
MTKRSFLQGLTILAACLLLGTVLGLLADRVLARQEYRTIAQMLGAAQQINPQAEDGMMQALKAASPTDFAAGDRILRQYGYGPAVFHQRHALTLVGIGTGILLIPGVGLLIWLLFLSKRQQGRIRGLTTYLEQVNLGREMLLVRQEDGFSRLEDELYKTVTELRQTREKALRERQALAENLADISHQLKTPMTSMSLMTQLLADSCEGEEADYVDNLSRQLRRLEMLVASLLKLSRLDAGTLEFKREPVDVYAMLLRAVEPLEEALRLKQLRLDILGESGSSFKGDSIWTAEAFLNLIKNCSEHTPAGGTVTLRYSQNPLYTEIVVEDNGEGFRMEELPHLFDRFYKGKNAAKDSAGIGLAISRSIIANQNGSIRAENAPHGGARFTVKFYA